MQSNWKVRGYGRSFIGPLGLPGKLQSLNLNSCYGFRYCFTIDLHAITKLLPWLPNSESYQRHLTFFKDNKFLSLPLYLQSPAPESESYTLIPSLIPNYMGKPANLAVGQEWHPRVMATVLAVCSKTNKSSNGNPLFHKIAVGMVPLGDNASSYVVVNEFLRAFETAYHIILASKKQDLKMPDNWYSSVDDLYGISEDKLTAYFPRDSQDSIQPFTVFA